MARVLHLYSDRNWTGPAEPVINLCAALGSQFKVILIHETKRRRPVRIAPMAIERGVAVETPLYLRKHRNLTTMAADVMKLVPYIKKRGFQLIHVHRLPDHIVGGLAGRVAGIPVLRTLYSQESPSWLLEKFAMAYLTAGLIVPNETARANVLDQISKLRAKIWVVPPGVDTARFDPKRVSREYTRKSLGIGPDEYVLGIASRIRSSRQVGVAVEAFGIAQKKLAHLRLVIIGWGKRSNIEKCIREPVKRFGMEDRVLHLGYLQRESYVEALAATDAGIYLTPGSDKSCRTILEFMALGKPLIVGKQGILSGLVENAENGFVVECNPEKVAGAIVHLASDPLLGEKMGERGLARVRARFSLNLQAAAISKIYKLFLSAALFVESILPLDQACFIF
jgi:glycosyltransferase involved in cell wall biosynthesis